MVLPVENHDRFARHDVMFLVLEDHQGQQFLHGAGAPGKDDEGIRVFNHDLHPGIDVRAQPETGQAVGQALELDDVGHI